MGDLGGLMEKVADIGADKYTEMSKRLEKGFVCNQ